MPGQEGTGDEFCYAAQLIGTNLYSGRDTHVLLLNLLSGPSFQGQLVSYNNATTVAEGWQLEPSLRWYRQSDDSGVRSQRWTPGLRLTWRMFKQLTLESELNVENAKTTGPSRNETSSRTYYYLGSRFEF